MAVPITRAAAYALGTDGNLSLPCVASSPLYLLSHPPPKNAVAAARPVAKRDF
jgi:hypothetical protein